jgi:hypothetical protein
MVTLAFLLLFPLAWPFIAKAIWKHEITLGELGANIGIGVVVVLIGWFAGRSLQTSDYEVLNGQVTSKSSRHVSCDHSYSCNCRQTCSGSGKNKSCSTTCDTCHEHSYDVDWNLFTSVGTLRIDRIDRRGIGEPPRYMRAQVGDPVAQSHSFTNYVKAAPDSLFNTAIEQKALMQFDKLIPQYPGNIYDYHYINRVLTQGVAVPDVTEWNRDLAMRLRNLGPTKQVNAVILFTNQKDPQYATALRAAWLGGKKNDVIVVMGTPSYPAIDWVRVISWTDEELFKVQLRDDLLDLKTVDRTAVLNQVEQHIATQFKRKHMKDFEYLQSDIKPPTWALILLIMLSIGSSLGASLYFARNDVREGGYRRGRVFGR